MLSSALAVSPGSPAKCSGITPQPRFIIIQAATGESIPPEISATTRPSIPSGSPPGARTVCP